MGPAKESAGAEEPSSYPAAQGRPASAHEDLMVIYQGGGGGSKRAIYFDSEGHVINYVATVSDDNRTLTFLSDPAPQAPRFRLSYTKEKDDSVRIKFEIAPPSEPGGFKTYLEGSAVGRRGRSPQNDPSNHAGESEPFELPPAPPSQRAPGARRLCPGHPRKTLPRAPQVDFISTNDLAIRFSGTA